MTCCRKLVTSLPRSGWQDIESPSIRQRVCLTFNRSARSCLSGGPTTIAAMERYALGHGTLEGTLGINLESERARGFDEARLAAVEAALASAFDIKFTFNKWTFGERLGIAPGALDDPSFELLAALGIARAEIDAANSFCCGAMTLEGAAHRQPEHLAVFDCANRAAAPADARCRSTVTSA